MNYYTHITRKFCNAIERLTSDSSLFLKRIHFKFSDFLQMLKTPGGRTELIKGVSYRSWPVSSKLAGFYRKKFLVHTHVISVVGSFGKSTTMRAIKTALGLKIHRRDCANAWGLVAMAVFRVRPSHRYAVIEVGIDRPRDMQVYARVLKPDTTVVTSIGSEHNRSLKTIKITRQEKSEMIKALPAGGFAVLNGDDPNVTWMADKTQANVITFGTDRTNAVWADGIELDWPHGTRFTLHADGCVRKMRIRLLGKHMLYPILAATAAALAQGLNMEDFLPALEAMPPTTGRMQPVILQNGAILLRDDFKSSYETILTALDVFAEIPARRKLLVIGEISEPPGSQGPIYREVGSRFGTIADLVIHVGGKLKKYRGGAVSGGLPRDAIIDIKNDLFKTAALLKETLQKGDVALIKGRDNQRMERIVHILNGRRVKCAINFCGANALRCDQCSMLEKGWNR